MKGKTFKFNPKNHSYTLDGQRMTGVTTILGVIAKPALIPWAANMAVDYIKNNTDSHYTSPEYSGMIYKVKEEVLEEARTAHTRRKEEAGAKGTDVHALVEEYIKDCIANNKGNADPLFGIYADSPMVDEFIEWAVENKVQFLESEKRIYSEEWFVAGTADFTCIINNQRFVGDLKTMKKMWDRTPFFQTAAYMKMLVEQGEEKYDGTIIVNINKETNKLTEYRSYDFEADIKSFEGALQLYRTLNI